MKRLTDYVPLPNGQHEEPYTVACHGDQLSCERMVDARFAMGDHDLPANTLKGLEPWPGEFHHRCLHLQDTMNELFNGSSASQRGTLYHMKNRVIGVESVAEIRLPDVDAEKYMTDLCRDIVTMLWPQTSEVDFTSDAPNDAGGDDDGGDDEDKLCCSCRRTERNMQYGEFHLRCTGLSKVPEKKWYCSTICEKQQASTECATSTKDHVKEYTSAVAWQGLMHRVRLDAERENDGTFLNQLWKLSMINLWNGNHYKYLILGHRITAGAMRSGHGHFSEAHAERISQLVGSAGQTIDKLYMSKVACSYSKTGRDHKGVKTADVHKFLTGDTCGLQKPGHLVLRDQLLASTVTPNRFHPSE
ncbi:hypothetical protein LSAT2_016719 [Lamellibrachia satsuma]|nr:hypothetical protein LSAT2_016719 [Lamellibrachia satsuma]